MKKLILLLLTAIISFGYISKSWAANDCAEGEVNCWDCGKTESDLCTARLDTAAKSLSITGSGEMRDYEGAWNNGSPTLNTPWGMRTYTSLSVQGVKNIGMSAFAYSIVTNAYIADSVVNIGNRAFNGDYYLQEINIPDSITSLGALAFLNNHTVNSVFIPESVTKFETALSDNEVLGVFDSYNGQRYKIYCAETTPCDASNADKIKAYTKDSDGVYKIGNNYYASPDDILANRVCGSGSTASDECIVAALDYQEQKAENMAGGALCATKEGCMELINMANIKDVCQSIADCSNYAKTNNLSLILCENKEQVVWQAHCYDEYPFAKKHWIPAEANQWLYDNDNTVIMTFKVNR